MKKKIMSLALALVMCMTLCVPALAEDSAAANSMPTTLTQQEQAARINLYNQAWFRSMRAPMYANYGPHYTYNSGLGQITGYVYGQANYPQYKVGNSNLASVGCEIAAVYNALRYNGRQIAIASIIQSFEYNGYLMAGGYFGSDPYAIGEYLDQNNVSYTEFPDNSSYTSFKNEVTSHLSSRRTYIVSFWNGPSLFDQVHTVAFYSQNGSLHVYNLNTCDTTTTPESSLADFVSSNRFIIGYALGERSRVFEG